MNEGCLRSYGQNVKVISRIFYLTPYNKISSLEALLVWIRQGTLGVKMNPCNKEEGVEASTPLYHATKRMGSRPRHFFLYANKPHNFESSHTLHMSWPRNNNFALLTTASFHPQYPKKNSKRPSILCINLWSKLLIHQMNPQS